MKKIILACSIALFAALLTPGQETGLLTLGQGTGITTNREYVRVESKNRLTNEVEVKYVPLLDKVRAHQITTTQQDVPVKIINSMGEEINLESLPLRDQEKFHRVQQTVQSLIETQLRPSIPFRFPGQLLGCVYCYRVTYYCSSSLPCEYHEYTVLIFEVPCPPLSAQFPGFLCTYYDLFTF